MAVFRSRFGVSLILAVEVLAASCGNDIEMVSAEQCESQGQVKQPALAYTGMVWSKEKVVVCWQDLKKEDEPYAELVKEQVTRYWDSQIELDFVGWGRCNLFSGADIKIKVVDERSWSVVGNAASMVLTSMSLNFTFKKFSPNCSESKDSLSYCIGFVAIHEFGHALGLDHEQNRSDTPEWCANSVEREENFRGNVAYGAWDKNSVMNYCALANKPSCTDIAAVQNLYGPESDTTARLVVGQ